MHNMAQIKKDTSLRKAILQAAITGQLINTFEGSKETGKELLDRIIEERNKKLIAEWEEALKKNPKAKKPVPVVASEIDEEEIPFEIPENWCWCKLSDYLDIRDGTHDSPKFYNEGIPFVTSKNLNNGKLDFSDCKFITEEDHKKFSARSFVEDGDILFAMIGSIGNPVMVKKEFDFSFKNMALFKRYSKENTDMKYIYHYLCHIQNELKEIATGGVQSFIGLSTFRELLFPLPPIAVQNAIVAKLEQVLPLVDAYENAILQKEELKTALPDKVKKAILQEAITGQLTESWRKSATIKENGKQLLDRIIEERNAKALAEWEEALKKNVGGKATLSSFASKTRAKKPVPVVASEIDEDEIPFEVPENWCWCRLGDLVPFGQCENAEPNEIEDDAWILDLEDIEKDSGRILQFKTKKEVDSKSTKHIFKKGYVLYSKLRPYLNKCVIAPQDGYCTSEILPLDFGKLINNKYAQTFLMSPYFVDYTDSLSFGVKMPRLGTEDGKKALVPLPPLEEQEEIVKKVEELLPLCK